MDVHKFTTEIIITNNKLYWCVVCMYVSIQGQIENKSKTHTKNFEWNPFDYINGHDGAFE